MFKRDDPDRFSRDYRMIHSSFNHQNGTNLTTSSSLQKAIDIQNFAAKYRFDWPDIQPVFEKLHEEIDELKHAIEHSDAQHIESELGDILFVMANIARHLSMDPDKALQKTMNKFDNRFAYVLQKLNINNQDHSHSLEAMENVWQQSKRHFP